MRITYRSNALCVAWTVSHHIILASGLSVMKLGYAPIPLIVVKSPALFSNIGFRPAHLSFYTL